MKIAFITNDLGLGGVQKLTTRFANAFQRQGDDVHVVTMFSRPESFFCKGDLSADVSFTAFSFSGIFDMRSWFKLYLFLRREKFDVVFTQLFFADTVGRIAAFFAGVPVIATEIQNLIPRLPSKYILTDRLLTFITTVCISPTSAITRYARDVIRFPQSKIVEVPTNVVDPASFAGPSPRENVRASLGIPEGARVALTIGRLVEQKGHSVLLKAIRYILDKDPETQLHFLLVGSGDLGPSLREQARALDLGKRLIFLGERNDVADLLRSADMFVFPSLWEGQGLILFEAMFARIPIIASRVGGIPDAIEHNRTGILVPSGDSNALAEAILLLAADRALGESLAQTAYEQYKDRTIEVSTEKLRKAFEVDLGK